jgi:hypothetical protein
MPFVPFLSSLFANSSIRRFSRRFDVRLLGTRRDRRVARIWFLKPLCERLDLIGQRLNLVLLPLDLRFVTGNNGFDEIARGLGLRC